MQKEMQSKSYRSSNIKNDNKTSLSLMKTVDTDLKVYVIILGQTKASKSRSNKYVSYLCHLDIKGSQ